MARTETEMTTKSVSCSSAAALPVATKSKRVRTGCLTCRERHLKCDEATPDCCNCRKSNRRCKRGIRLNFLDIQVYSPAYLHSNGNWDVHFQDESRLVASEYRGGLKRYANVEALKPVNPDDDIDMILKRLEVPSRLELHPGADGGRGRLDQGAYGGARQNYGVAIPALRPVPSQPRDRVIFRQDTRIYDAGGVGIDEAVELSSLATDSSGRSTTLHGFTQSEHRLPANFEALRQDYSMRDASSATSSGPQLVNPPPTRQSCSEDKAPLGDTDMSPLNERPQTGERDFLGTSEEVHYMQVFVEKVGSWMDAFEKDRHFSELIPYQALKSPKLLNAFLACGVKHLSRTSHEKEDKALFYYNTATTQLLRSLQNPDRDVGECAIAAVVLNVYEIMSDRPGYGMNHVAGARALIRECKWDAKSTGSKAACFWLNIGMEVLSCLEMNWLTTWDPDHWGLDMNMTSDADHGGDKVDEQIWVHRMFYIVARVTNFRASMPQFLEPTPRNEQLRLGGRTSEWRELKRLCDDWNEACPRTMHPMGYLYPGQSLSNKSLFPRIWLIKRAAVLGRLFYHTALCILAQTHPMEPVISSEEMQLLQLHHAHQICGIVAHTDDQSIASVAVRSLASAAPALVDRGEQTEALEVLRRKNARSGWKLAKAETETEVKRAWGWEQAPTPYQDLSRGRAAQHGEARVGPFFTRPVPSSQRGTIGASNGVGPARNPLRLADFSLPNHPYKNWYEPPNKTSDFSDQFF